VSAKHDTANNDHPSMPLRDREREIVQMRIRGLNLKDIAARLGISYATCRTYYRRANAKLKHTSK
jgi:DNA-binding CsgD family transcriptional regulator